MSSPVFSGPTDRSDGWLLSPRKGHAVNLAVLRIVVFGAIAAWVAPFRLAWFASLPPELVFVPWGSEWLVDLLPPDPATVGTLSVLLLVFATFAAAGLFTRISAALTVCLALYVMLVPQLYGKVNHYHHLVWFAAVLAASPCGDALSIDALRRRRSLGLGLPRATRYYWPVAVVWVLMGLVYFFPGFWKLVVSGPDWALSENLKFQMWAKWLELGNWRPVFRLDRHPLLFRAAGGYTMLFELSFLGLVLHEKTRRYAAIGGLLFHVGTGLILNIWFATLLVVYASFVDWAELVGRFRKSLRPLPGRDEDESTPGGLATSTGRRWAARTVAAGALIVLGATWTGAFRIERGWPFAAYPSFTPARTGPTTFRLVVTHGGDEGGLVRVGDVRERLGGERYTGMLRSLMRSRNSPYADRRFEGFGRLLLREEGTDVGEGEVLRLFLVVFSTTPGGTHRALETRLLYEWRA